MPFFDRIDNFIGDALSGVAAGRAQAAAYASGPASAGPAGTLRIEPGQVDAAIKIFQDALNKLEDRVTQAKVQVRAQAMGSDGVSAPAAAAFNDASLSGPGSAIAAWSGAVKELQAIIDQLRASKQANVLADNGVAQSFTSASGVVG